MPEEGVDRGQVEGVEIGPEGRGLVGAGVGPGVDGEAEAVALG